ncbi:von Willebrand factor type A domain-containing protein [Hymenobacter sp. 15J16-1T3B]|uniref:YfbK domain-containing protein n=1 Tax=Hymenobacter sp. 15J16-1T3B TaxID=2886941 RepID=UPI001D1167DB|nr:von Willebrand factor type A domain-containing protein [Hymenobacter sp. 15J16-1T3B]MCC3156247.1 von Willebrand factor type A domain-containing protein [Hymenobacter sp. 15J16-1T3B]
MRTVLYCSLLAAALGSTYTRPVAAQNPKTTRTAAPIPTPARAVQGVVTDSVSGQPLPGATVVLKGTSIGTSTAADGTFRLPWPGRATRATLLINALGYSPTELTVRPGQRIGVALAPAQNELKEVVVTGVAPAIVRKDISYAAATVTQQSLAGRLAGVQIRGSRAPGKAKRSAAPAASGYFSKDEKARRRTEGEGYAHQTENAFQPVSKAPLSTFSIDVDAASYSNVRRFLTEQAQLPPADAVRTEELVNYFRYDYPQPAADAPAALHLEQARCPWAPAHQLVLIGLQARTVPVENLPPANLVFLIDVSGSMQSEDKLPLVKAGLKQLVQQLRPQDQVALVVYAGAAGVVLPPTPGTRKGDIVAALDKLEAGGSTAGGEGLRLAYATARQHFNKEGNNRVVLCTDGDFNVGESSDDAMEHLITQERESGVFLSVLGFGTGNLQDSKMERLADKGNGNYAYIDQLGEARRVLVQQFGGTLFTLAKDVKLQVEFNPAKVQAYRLIGYENRLLADEDFNNDQKDAGELGAGQQVTALYEVVPVGAPPVIDGLKYQPAPQATAGAAATELLTVKMRYKQPQGRTSSLLSQALPAAAPAALAGASTNLRWAAAVAQMSLLLRQSERRGEATWQNTVELARAARGKDDEGYRAECIRLMETAASLTPGAYGSR